LKDPCATGITHAARTFLPGLVFVIAHVPLILRIVRTEKPGTQPGLLLLIRRSKSTVPYVVTSTPRQNATWCFTLRAAGLGSG
jgi:hypothetical protein